MDYANVTSRARRGVSHIVNVMLGHPAGFCPASYAYYFVNEQKQFVYATIPKVASGSLSIWFLNTMGIHDKKDFYTYIRNRYILAKWPPFKARYIWRNYFKFTFVRNPWSRLLGAYTSKFIKGRKINPFRPSFSLIGKPVVNAIYRAKGKKPDYEKSITFREFVEYVCAIKNDYFLESHWRPQSWYVDPRKFDFIGKFESLDDDLAIIQSKIKTQCSLPHKHKVETNQYKGKDGELAEMPAQELIQMEERPHYHSFYTDELIQMVAERYKRDIEWFGYEF